MTYFIKSKIKPLFYVTFESIKESKSGASYMISVTSNFKAKSIASNVVIQIPTPSDAMDITIKQREGNASY